MAAISGFIVISLFVCVFFLIGFINVLTNHEENKCEMTYMFEYPQFVRVRVPENQYYPRYGLYVYSEGRFTENARAMKFTGIPVLFIPGNAGSYKQVRSLASVALRKAQNSRSLYHFDFFTVDLNEELSGLSGGVLTVQSEFVKYCLQRILNLYSEKQGRIKPKDVIVIGHSMGGVIGEKILLNETESDKISLLLTLSSPHLRPMIMLDKYMNNFYENIDNVIENSTSLIEKKPHLKTKSFISIGSGYRDKIVASMLTPSKYNTLHVLTNSIPAVWLSVDHNCIVWCKQLVLVIIRALFDVVDPSTRQITTDTEYRNYVFTHYFVNNSGIKPVQNINYDKPVRLITSGEWIEKLYRQYSEKLEKGTLSTKWYMVRLIPDNFQHRSLSVRATNIESSDWVYVCSANSVRGNSRVCEEAINLSHLSRISPSLNFKRRTFYINLHELKKQYPTYTHVVIRVLPTSEPVKLDIDIFDHTLREMTVSVPAWYSLSRTIMVTETVKGALQYSLKLRGLESLHQAYLLYLEPLKCEGSTYHSVTTLSVPWGEQSTHHIFTETEKKPMIVKLHSPKPLNFQNETTTLSLILDPQCQYIVSIRSSIVNSLGQMVRFYSPMLFSSIGAALLLSLRWQLLKLSETSDGYCPPLHSALASAAKPYYLVTAAKLLGKVLSLKTISIVGLPRPDLALILDWNMEFLLLPLALYAAAVGFAYIISILLWAAVIFSGSAVNKLALRFLARSMIGTISWSNWLMTGLHRLPFIVAIAFIALGWSTCGALALGLGAVFYFLKLTKMYEDYLEEIVFHSVKTVAKKFGKVVRNTISSNMKDKNVEGSEVTDNKNTDDFVPEELVENVKDDIIEVNSKINESKELNNEENKEIENKSKDKEVNEDNVETNDGDGDAKEDIKKEDNTTDELKTDSNKDSIKNETMKKLFDTSFLGAMHFHFTGFFIWVLISCVNIPSVLTWAHNFKFDSVLDPDPSFIHGLTLCICGGLLWQIDMPKPNLKFYKELGVVLYLLALLVLIYTPISLYRLPYILTIGLALVTLHQLLAPTIDINEETEISEEFSDELQDSTVPSEQAHIDQRDAMKAKWE